MQRISNVIRFYRKCYRSDNRDLSIWNVFKADDAYWPDATLEELATGDFPRIPLAREPGEVLLKKCELKVRESNLVYAVAFIAGKLTGLSGFSTERDICSPLIYYDAKIEYQDENYYIKIDVDNPHINYSLVSAISSSEDEDSAQDDFPEVSGGLDNVVVGNIVSWLNKSSTVDNTLELVRFPKLLNKEAARTLTGSLTKKNNELVALPAATLLLVDRPKGSRGVLHELKTLESCKHYSAPLMALFSTGYTDGGSSKVADKETGDTIIPGLLSMAQIKALDIAGNNVLGLVSGPPGTGKSYTIAAIALDRILQGEHVLIVSETDQALDVINTKLADDFNVGKAALRTGKKEFLRELKKTLDDWLKTGVVYIAQDEIEKLKKSLQILQKKIQKTEKKFISRANQSIAWGHSLAGSTLLDRIKRFYIKWRIEVSEPHWEKINELESLLEERDKKAALYLKKWLNSSIRNLLKHNREELSKFNMAIRARSSKKQLELHEEIDYRTLLGAFPVWLASLDMIHYSLPLKKHLFDLLIIDEATQCDIASVIPALQRARRVLIVGDSKQLKHVSFISYENEKKMYLESGMDEQNYEKYSYKRNSILDLVSNVIKSQDSVVMLDEHYRSKPDLISFSNDKFYNSRLKIMQHRPDEFMTGNIIIKNSAGTRNKQGVNRDEATAVIEMLTELILNYTDYAVKPSIGVLSPYRDQAVYLQKLLLKHVSLSDIEAHAIRVATPYGFQGDEKDYMLISMSVDNDSRRAAAYLNRADMFNVAVTRSRQKIYLFSSIDHSKLPVNNLFRQYMESISSKKAVFNADEAKFDSFQHEVCNVLESNGITTRRSYPVAGRNVDILCRYKTSTLAIDLTGFPGECSEFLELETYYLFSRAGLDIFPLSYGQWIINNELCVSEIKNTLSVL
ncbi:DNA helicase [hydrothermal vent metagenome]|uniref:DNA helicase n=1 Tax=hydrothermal vent metagenome TaxID=652676 RepID=A0A3B0WPJ2_9ZZZZ